MTTTLLEGIDDCIADKLRERFERQLEAAIEKFEENQINRFKDHPLPELVEQFVEAQRYQFENGLPELIERHEDTA
jgi:hypothetical protein